jgi:hypothetical protein
MPKVKTVNKAKSPKNLGLALFVAIFALFGVWYLVGSHAATTSYAPIGYYNYASVANLNQGVFTTTDTIAGLGAQTVADIEPGQKLTFVLTGKLAPSTMCYAVRIYNSPKSVTQVTNADVTFVGTGSSLTVNLPADDSYREVCVPAGRKAQLSYNVANLSPAAYVLIYQATAHY